VSATEQHLSDLLQDLLGRAESLFVGDAEDPQSEREEKGVSVAIAGNEEKARPDVI